MGREDQSPSSFRGRGGPPSRGGPGFRGGRGGGYQRGGFQQGPPSYVVPTCTYEHPCENQIVVKATDLTRVPKFNRGVYLQSKAKIGSVDEIFGPINEFYYSAKLQQGIKASSLKKGQVLYMSPEDMLPLDRFLPKPKVPGQRGAGASRGGPRGGGGFRGGAPRGGGFQRGGPRGGGFQRGGSRGGSFRGGRGRGG